jgi:integrase/recombinase XerD
MQTIDMYVEYIKGQRNLSQNTITSYYLDLKKYKEYIEKNNIIIEDLNEGDIINYLIYLEKQNISTSSISRTISSIKSFHDFLFSSRITENNPAKNIKKPKIEKSTINILTEDEIETLLNSPNLDSSIGIRDKAIFETLYGTGIKVSELVKMDLQDVNIDMEYIDCRYSKCGRIIPLSNTNKKYLTMYLNKSRDNLIKGNGEEALFVNSNGHRFTRQGLWKVIKKHAHKCSIDKSINPTMLRHSFAIHLLNGGANISVVSKILGNSNLASLQCYLNHINQNVRKEIKEKHPRK